MKSIAIIGGGITGLTAAFRLKERNVPVTLYESSARAGGVIETGRHQGYLAEFGPNSILETSPKIGALIRDLGLEQRRLYADARANNRYIVRGGRPLRVPDSPLAFLASSLFSPAAKLRLLAEPFIHRVEEGCEESVAEFVTRRIGREFLDYAINPLVAGIYAGNPARLSVKHAFPKLHALEERYGSLILGQFLGARERKRRADVSKDRARKLSFDEGLQVLTDTLAARLTKEIRFQSPVNHFEQTPHGWIVMTNVGGHLRQSEHEAVVFAGPTYRLPGIQLLSDRCPNWSPLAQIHYPPVASVVLGFRREDVTHPLDGFGVLIPELEGFNILGTIFSSSLFPNRAPEGHVTLTSYIGGERSPELALSDPEKLVDLTLKDLGRILGVKGRPTFKHPVLFPKAIPQYEVGYGRYKDLMNEVEEKAPGFFMAGHYRNGISLSDSIVAGHDVAEKVENFLAASVTAGNARASAEKAHLYEPLTLTPLALN
jgi:oxygen-dependent protoporphyrinogen oxidase